MLSHIRLRENQDMQAEEERRRRAAEEQLARAKFEHDEATALEDDSSPGEEAAAQQAQPFVREDQKVGRNEPCPCGSGKKYKHCHGTLS